MYEDGRVTVETLVGDDGVVWIAPLGTPVDQPSAWWRLGEVPGTFYDRAGRRLQ